MAKIRFKKPGIAGPITTGVTLYTITVKQGEIFPCCPGSGKPEQESGIFSSSTRGKHRDACGRKASNTSDTPAPV